MAARLVFMVVLLLSLLVFGAGTVAGSWTNAISDERPTPGKLPPDLPDVAESSGTSCSDRVVHTRLSPPKGMAKKIEFDVVGDDCRIVFGPVQIVSIQEARGTPPPRRILLHPSNQRG
ncbi:MAG: hypothetical protein HY681_08345 [Chloroflexi bacterium]|nr:hypothetical protein [Chloroflexota bacterium]